ncbi:MAG: membrane protein insertase YidC [Ruminococcaceae bacterium]|nr:membrane protein insertase YidC [Oscillospiraceae bacterium]
MDAVIDFLIGILGWIMYGCYYLIKNYGLSIIVFTFITKLILFPVSLLTQKNSIKMVQMQPQLNALKIKYIDDKDKYTDEQVALYKKYKYNPFMDTIPLLIQIPIILGLVGVVYRPLSYVMNIDRGVIEQLKDWLVNTLGIEADNMFQLSIFQQIREGAAVPSAIPQTVVDMIRNFDMNFCGFNLGLTPSFSGNYELLLIPLLAGLSAWLLCFAQNKINVLQIAQNNAMKITTSVIMIAFSVYFCFLVPAGVGLYWIFGNLFAIPSMVLCNVVIPPKKYIDYDYLLKSKEQMLLKEKEHKKYSKREKADYKRFFSVENMQLMIYSESNGFYKYYAGTIDYICEHSDIQIHYVTSDPNDKIFEDKRQQIHSYFVASDKLLIPLFMKLDCDMCVMTMPDLEKYHIKRSRVRKDIEYVYVVHGIGSNALTLRKGALDWYDTMFCPTVDGEKEVREMEELYHTKPKVLIEAGYMLIDEMIEKYDKMEKKENDPPKILIAPSWQPDNIIDLCVDELLEQLQKTKYEIILRPHPQAVRHAPEKFAEMHEKYDGTNIEVQTDFSSNNPVMEADVLITDWSDISFEFAFTTKRPVLFINTPMKIMNPEYDKIATTPINISLRNVLGKAVEVDELDKVNGIIDEFIQNRASYHDTIENTLNERVYNVGKSKVIYGRYIIKRLAKSK